MKIKSLSFLVSAVLCIGLFVAQSATGAQELTEQIEQREWSAEDITGAWEVVSRVYITLPEKDTVHSKLIEDIEQVNKNLENKRVVERFSDEVYNHLDSESGGENAIYDKKVDKLYVYNTGESSVYEFSFEQYLKNVLKTEVGSSTWQVFEVLSELQTPILGFEVKKARVGGDEGSEVETGKELAYWVTPELPSWFDKLKGTRLPGFPLLRMETTYIENTKISFHREVVEIRPIDPQELLLTPPKELKLIPWDSISDDELYKLGIEPRQSRARDDEDELNDATGDEQAAKRVESSLTEIELTQRAFLEQLDASEPSVYDAVSVFQGGLARAERHGRSFYINAQGELAFDHKLGTVLASKQFEPEPAKGTLDGFRSLFQQSERVAQNPNCYVLAPYDEDIVEHFIVARGGKLGLVNGSDGRWLMEPNYERLEKRTCQMLKTYKGGQQGLSTVWGQELVPTEFDEVWFFGLGQYFAVKKEDLWGVYDAHTQKLAIPIQFQSLNYCGGCGLKPEYLYAQKADQWGVLDFKGNVVLPFEYEFPAHQNMRSGQWVTNLLKAGNRVLIHLGTGTHYFYDEYEKISVLNDFVIFKKNGKSALFNEDGQQITDYELSRFNEMDSYLGQKAYIEVFKNGERAVIDDSGALVIPWLKAKYVDRFRKNFFLVRYDEGDKLELRDLTGATLIPAEYSSYGVEARKDESNEIVDAPVLKIIKSNELQGWYLVNEGLLVEPAFDHIRYWEPKESEYPYIEVKKDNMQGLYALDGTELISPVYKSLRFLSSDLLIFQQESRYGLIDLHTGNELVSARYADINFFRSGRLLSMRLHFEERKDGEHLYHWWDTERKKMVELSFEDYEPLTNNGLWRVLNGNKNFLYEANTQQIISKPYDAIEDESNGLIIVEKNNYFGVINVKGEEVHPPEYDFALRNEAGFIALSQQNKNDFWETIYLRSDGKLVFAEPKVTWSSPDHYDAPLVREKEQEILVSTFNPKRRKDLIGIYGWDGKERLAPEYETLIFHDDGLGNAVVKERRVGFFDSQGNELFPTILDDVYYANSSMSWGAIRKQEVEFPLLVRIKAKYFYIDKNGETMPIVAESITEFD